LLQKSEIITYKKDIKNTIDNTKNRRSDEARVTMALLTASVSGESIKQSRSRVSLAKRLGVSVKRLARSAPARTQILHSNKSCFEYTKRKTRSDALTEDLKKRIYDPTSTKNKFSMAFLELYPIVVAAVFRGHLWTSKRILVLCDNEATVYIVNKGRSKCLYIMRLMCMLM
jgi:hypothetical protein